MMTIHLTPEQEQRIKEVIDRGSYEVSVDQVVDAAILAVEQHILPQFEGSNEELETLLAAGLASEELTEGEFWESVNKQTNRMLADHSSGARS